MHGCIVIVLAVHIHIHIYIYMIFDKKMILLNPFVGLLLGCKSSYTSTSGGLSSQCASRWFLNVFTVPLLTTSWGRAFQVVVVDVDGEKMLCY